MSDHFVVEADKSVVGVAVRGTGGFRFFTTYPDFKRMEGKTFRSARALVGRVREFAEARRRSAQVRERPAQ